MLTTETGSDVFAYGLAAGLSGSVFLATVIVLATERGFMEADGSFALLVLTGEGVYEGLSTMLVEVVPEAPEGDDEIIWEGYIFEGGLPPMPNPVEPSAE